MKKTIVVSVALVGLTAGRAVAQDYAKGWVDVNFGAAQAAEKEYTSVKVVTLYQEPGGGAVAYSLPRGGAFDVGGGYMFHRRAGIGVSLAGTAHKDTAGLAIMVPNPNFFNASATDATVTDGSLTRTEGAWHLHAMVVPFETRHFRVRVFGGPSYFVAEQERITTINYQQATLGRLNVVAIKSYNTDKSTASAWGIHGGGDVSVFFNRVVGLGFTARVSRGTVKLEDYGGTANRKVGGVQIGGGLRLKF